MKPKSRFSRRNRNLHRSANRHLRCEPLEERALLAVLISEATGGTAVTEGGVSAAYQIVLDSQPTADVTITLAVDSQLTASPTTLTFNTGNWNQSQQVQVGADDDSAVEGTHTASITHSAASSDAAYNGASINNVDVTITDNDSATNDPPTVSLTNTTTTLAENVDTAQRRKVADITLVDEDGEGTNELSLGGDDANLFEIDSGFLYLKAGVTLDFETNPVLNVTVAVDDTAVGQTPDDTAPLVITITNVNEAPVINTPGTQAAISGTALYLTGISIDDPDAGSADIEVKLEIGHGALTVRDDVAGGLVPGEIAGNGTGTLLLVGSRNQINNTLDATQGLKYVSNASFAGSETLTITADDEGNTGEGGVKTAQKDLTITVSGANQAPSIIVPAAQTVAEDTDLSITGISVSDPDAGSAEIRLTLAVAHGLLTVKTNVSGGLTAAKVQGNGTASVVLTGTVQQINATLDAVQGLVYRGQANYNGPDTLSVTADDQGNTGTGGAKNDHEQVAITVTAANDAPTITIPGIQAVPSGTELSLSGITIDDPDAGTASIEVKFEVDHGTLTFKTDVAGGLVAGDIVGNGTATVTVTGTVAKIKATLAATAGLKYLNTTGYTGPDTLTITADDKGNSGAGGVKTATKDLAITVAGVNQAPVIAVPGAQAGTEDTDLYITGISVSDADAGSGNVQVKLTVTHGVLTVKNDVAGGLAAANIQGNGTAAVTLTGSLAKINATLAHAQGLKYKGQTNSTVTATLTVEANDLGNTGTGGQRTDSKTVAIALSAVNDAPQITAPTALTVAPGTDLAVSGISIADVDAGTATVVVTLAIGHGTLTLRTDVSGGLVAADIQGNNTGAVTLTGTVAKINATLAASGGLKYRGTTASTTPYTLAVSVNDQGNTGSGGAKTAAKNVAITVTTANQAPVVTVPAAKTVAQNTDLVIAGVSVADADAGTGAIEVTLEVGHGVLTVLTGVSGGVPAGGVSGNGTAKVVLTGTVAQINATLAATNGLKYKSAATYSGADSLTVKADDNGNTGTGGEKTDQKSVAITVTGVNAAPVLTVPASAVVPKNGEQAITGISVADADAGTGAVKVTLEVSHGTLAVLTSVSGGVPAGGVSGNGTAKVILTGTVAQINATLAAANGLKYKPTTGYAGSDSIKVTADDQGNSGTGGAKTDQETTSVFVGSGSLSGYVFLDGNNDGNYTAHGNGTAGDRSLPGVSLKLRQKTGTGTTATWSDVTTVKTGPDGFFLFKDIPAGTYEIVETQPAMYRDGEAMPGSGGGTAQANLLTNIVLEAGEHLTDNNFTEAGIKPEHLGIRLFLSSTPSSEEIYANFLGLKKVTISGTSGNDDIQFTAGATSHTVVVNGKQTVYTADQVDLFVFDALAGNDKVTLNGKAGADQARIMPGYASLGGADYMVEVFGAEDVKIDGKGGNDNGLLYDSAGDDQLAATGSKATLSATDYLAELIAFERVQAISAAGGDDTATQQTIDYVLELIGDWND